MSLLFLELTSQYGEPIIVNMSTVGYFEVFSGGPHTQLFTSSGSLVVQETYAQILEMLTPVHYQPPFEAKEEA